jgi:hypothetical protein
VRKTLLYFIAALALSCVAPPALGASAEDAGTFDGAAVVRAYNRYVNAAVAAGRLAGQRGGTVEVRVLGIREASGARLAARRMQQMLDEQCRQVVLSEHDVGAHAGNLAAMSSQADAGFDTAYLELDREIQERVAAELARHLPALQNTGVIALVRKLQTQIEAHLAEIRRIERKAGAGSDMADFKSSSR